MTDHYSPHSEIDVLEFGSQWSQSTTPTCELNQFQEEFANGKAEESEARGFDGTSSAVSASCEKIEETSLIETSKMRSTKNYEFRWGREFSVDETVFTQFETYREDETTQSVTREHEAIWKQIFC
jgi:hypothetical protein